MHLNSLIHSLRRAFCWVKKGINNMSANQYPNFFNYINYNPDVMYAVENKFALKYILFSSDL